MATENSSGCLVTDTKDSILMINAMATEKCIGLMVLFIEVIGNMEFKMA